MSGRARVRLATVVTVVVALLVAGLSTASAASVTLSSTGRPAMSSVSRCGGTTGVTVRPSGTVTGGKYTQVTVTGVTGSCTTGRVIVSTPSGAKLADGQATVANGAFTVTVAAYTPPSSGSGRVFVSLDTWPVAATWDAGAVPVPLLSCTVLNDPSATCDATLTQLESWGWPKATDYNAYIAVSSPSTTTNAQWQITVNLADATFPFVAKSIGNNNQSQLAAGWSCASLPLLTLTGQVGPNTAYVGGGRVVTVYLHGTVTASGQNLFSCP